MAEQLSGKVAAVTGAASGIGLECARMMLAEGAQVVLIDRAADRLNTFVIPARYVLALGARYRFEIDEADLESLLGGVTPVGDAAP